MYNFKSCCFVAPKSRRVALIPCLTLKGRIFEDYVGRLEDTDGQRMGTIFADGFEEAWKQ
jgi:hypothetical protein